MLCISHCIILASSGEIVGNEKFNGTLLKVVARPVKVDLK